MNNPKIPSHAQGVLANLPWGQAKFITESFQGLWGGGAYQFPKGTTRGAMIVVTTDADIDADGPGGSTAVDPCWQSQTSLRFPNGFSCNSRQFPGVVLPPAFRQLGAWLGDFGTAIWHDAAGNAILQHFQVYDQGPTRKLGEISIFLGRLLGIVPSNQTDHAAATHGNDVKDLTIVLYCGSGPGRQGTQPGHAVASPLIVQYGASLFDAAFRA